MNKRIRYTGTSRRHFLKGAATVAAFTVVPRHVLGGPKFVPPSEKVNVAVIGCGGQGRTNLRELFKLDDVQVIAVADPTESADYDAFYYKGLAGRRPIKAEIEKHYGTRTPGAKCAEFEDFRVMLDKESAIDAVLIATPDHVHAAAAIRAMRAGKHVYCEKPLAHSVWECRRFASVAKESGVATQMGNQGHSGDGIRQTVEWIRAGAIGKIREVHAWSDAGRWVTGKGRPSETPPVPTGMNWDLWLGPRAARPYHSDYAPFNWRGWWAFGGGAFADMACHNIDNAVWALDLDAPSSVEAFAADGVDSERVPFAAIYHYHFPAKGDRPAVRLTWSDGGLRSPIPEVVGPEEQLEGGGNGTLFVGEKGVISCAGWGGAPRIFPMSLHEAYQRPTPSIPRSKGHHRDWIAACKGGPAASSNFEYGARLTEIILLGNVALRTGKKLWWDAPAMKATNTAEADAYLKGEYRAGWEIA
ncbi:MAG: Gfo/Idh/MocA family oxidoreductase [Verrucomicrobiales bacterium]|nr:Gfo/Idh/MocA family oxidoreductase [Verrucomicrobiales bacterium]